MGGFATLHLGFRPPRRALPRSCRPRLRLAEKEQQAQFRAEVEVVGQSPQGGGAWPSSRRSTPHGPHARAVREQGPRGFAQFKKELGEHSALESANTQIGVQGSAFAYDLLDQMLAMTIRP